MPQLHLYVSDDVAAALRARARERGTSVSKLLAEIVTRDAERAWPAGWLDRVAGAWPEPWPVVDDPPPDERRPLQVLLLDANVCIDVLRGRPDVVARLAAHGPAGLFLCSIVKAELAYGALLASDPLQAADVVDAFCAPFASLPFDDACVDAYARLRADLRASGATIGANDLAIAAIALTHGLGLVSDDRAAFARVPELTVTSWRGG